MNIFNTYRRTRFFLWINITGLAIGLAASMLLILFVVNELSYDKHFAGRKRIVRLLTVIEKDGDRRYTTINLRSAATELPGKTPGVETAVQMYNLWEIEVTADQRRFQNLKGMQVDAGFFKVLGTKFIEGTPDDCLSAPNSVVITRRWADVMFGSPEKAMNKTVSFNGMDFVVSGVVEAFPKNTHLTFDIVASISAAQWPGNAGGLEFITYYLIREGASVEDTRSAIEDEYRTLIKPWSEAVGVNAYGETEMLDDVYMRSKALGSTSSANMQFIWILTGLALFILLLAVTSFINLFVTQGQLRMNEIGIRKAGGAQIGDIVRQFFSEVALIVLIAFLCGFALAVACVPYFAGLVDKEIDLAQLGNPLFIGAAAALFVATVVLSAFYPAVYLSRFSPLDILGKRVKFSRRRLTATVVVFQSVISIVLLSVIVMLYRQTAYLERIPLGYNPDNLMILQANRAIYGSYKAVRQELLKQPEIKNVSASHHVFGGGYSGQVIAKWEERDKPYPINEYRLMTGMPDLMGLELVEGRFWSEEDPDSIQMLLLNEAAVKMMGGESPLEKTYSYHGRQTIVTGVVKDFYYDNPASSIAPMVLTRVLNPGMINIRFHEGVGRLRAHEVVEGVCRQFDPGYVLNPSWSADIYADKFDDIKTIMQMALAGSLVAIFVAMLGLLAIHLFTAMRRTRETGIRRIYGAGRGQIFVLLSLDMLKWIGYAAVVAIPVAAYSIDRMMGNYANRVSSGWVVFVLPVVAQCAIALLTTSGVTLNVLRRNPTETVKSE
ncbi:MAG: ABC transporter permease [Tannerella sp.]|jgi:putative ABC transport system permease protein|nr:ABC transporter permease [Tannerella sp.]